MKIYWVLVAFVLIVFGSMGASWLYASSEYAIDGRFEIDLIGSFLCLFFSVGLISQIIIKLQEKMPKGFITKKVFNSKLNSLNL